MNGRVAAGLVKVIRAQAGPPPTDRDLLLRFAHHRDEAAFAELVARHSGLVFGVCRRLLPTVQDAEDVCQAAFLVLARQAAVDRWQPSIANWLYATARNLAAKANRTARRRQARERAAGSPPPPDPLDQLTAREWLVTLDEELARLPAIYREALALCCLEGLSREEAAAQLGCPVGTGKVRLERGRKRLEAALCKRGVGVGLGLLTLVATSPAQAAGPRLLELILATVAGTPPPDVAALAQGVAVTGLLSRCRTVFLVILALATLGIVYAARPPAPEPAAPADPPAREGVDVFTYAGTVLDPAGKPLAGARVHISGLNRGTIEFVEKARSDADGKFRFSVRRADFHGREDREPGKHVWIGATAPKCGPAVRGLYEGKGRDAVTLWLAEETVVKARVVDLQGKPLAGVKLGADIKYSRQRADLRPVAFDAEDKEGDLTSNVMPYDPDHLSAVTDRDGRCELRGLGKDWQYQLFISGPGIVHSHVELVTRPEKAKLVPGTGLSDGPRRPMVTRYGSDFVHVAEPAKPIVGVVRDRASGKPIAKTRVGKAWVRDGEAFGWTETDAAGRFRLDGLPRGVHTLTIEPPSPYLRTEQVARADAPGTEPFDCTINLTAHQLVRGKVSDAATGKPVQGRVVYHPFANNSALRDAPYLAEPRWPRRTLEATLDATGAYSLPVLPGRGVLFVHAEGGYRPAALTAADRRVGLFDKADAELFDTRPYPTRCADANAVRVIDVAADKPLACDVTVDPGRRLALTVLDPDGKPVTAVALGLLPEPADHSREVKNGRGTIAALAEGERRRVYVRAKDRPLGGALTLRGDERDGVTLRLQPLGTLTGTLLGDGGKPLAGASFQLAHDAGVFVSPTWIVRLQTEAEAKRDRRLGDLRRDKTNSLHGTETTDAAGRFRLDGVLPGVPFDLRVMRTRPSRDGKSRYIDGFPKVAAGRLDAGETKNLGTLRLP